MPGEREEELRLERCARPAGVEVREKRIVLFVADDRRFEPRAQPLGQHAFPKADRAVDGEVPELQGRRV